MAFPGTTPLAVKKKRPKMGAQLAAEQKAITAPTAPTPEPPQPPKSVPPPQPPSPVTTQPAKPPAPPQVSGFAAPQLPPAAPPISPALQAGIADRFRPEGSAGSGNSITVTGDPRTPEGRESVTDADGQEIFVDPAEADRYRDDVDAFEQRTEVGGAPTTANAGTSPFDQAAADFLLAQLQGGLDGANTAEEEALIRQQLEDAIGAQLVNQRASMGRAGFGSSGAMAAIEGDIQRTARQQALEDILGLRRTENQRAIDNAQAAIGSDIDLRKQAEDEFFNQEFLNTLQSVIDAEGGGASGGGGGPMPADANGDGTISLAEQQAAEARRQQDARAAADAQAADERINSGIAGGNPIAGETSEDGESIQTATGTFTVEQGKRNEDDVLSQTVTVDGKRYHVFRDGKASKPGQKPVLYAVPA